MPVASFENALQMGTNALNLVTMAANNPAPASPGAQFLAANAGLVGQPGNHANILQVTQLFQAFLTANGWTWAPGGAGDSRVMGARLLDGTVTAGECAFVAHALEYLLAAPAPYGFNMLPARQAVKGVQSYRGANNDGFISTHAAVFNLAPNLVVAGANYYSWDNHKVVPVGGNFYDACYGVHYAAIADMAVADRTWIRQQVRLRDLAELDWAGFATAPKLVALAIKDMWFRNRHSIDVFQGTNAVGAHALNGFYLDWSQTWSNNPVLNNTRLIHGPLGANPLVR